MSYINFKRVASTTVQVSISHQTVYPVENCEIVNSDGSGIIGVRVEDETKPFVLGASEVVPGENRSRMTEQYRMKYSVDPRTNQAVKI